MISFANSYPSITRNVEEIGGDFEGDILLTSDTILRGIGTNSPSARWPNGIVPYEISSEYGKINYFDYKIFFLNKIRWI